MSNWKAAWALSWLALAVAGPLAGERVALVIGNGAYRGGEITELSNPGNDARAVAAKLDGLGFEVISGIDLGRAEFFDLLGEFGEQAEGAEAALLFYAGHGMQVEGKNYLIPVDTESLEKKTDLGKHAVNLDDVLAEMRGKTNLVFLDACRNNPFRGFRGSGGRGLAAVSAKSMGGGVLISYAADPGKLALDGEGQNSPYTEALLKHMGRRGVSVGDMLTGVKADVEDATGGTQHPWTSLSMRAPFYFVGDPVDGRCDVELLRLSWTTVKDAGDEDELQLFIEEHEGCRGAGVLVKRAKNLLEELEQGPTLKVGEVFRDCDECPQMVVVPAGSFMMGSPESEEGRDDDEGPEHRVEIGEAFAVGAYEVTFEEWDACVAAGGCGRYRPDDKDWGRGGRPVINVSWEDAQAYVEWLSRKTGKQYRLLSEAEWEYAARGGSGTRYWWGDEIGSGRANCDGCGSRWDDEQTAPVRSFRGNGYGLYDMHGNVWEWVQDCWNDNYRGAPTDGKVWKSGDCSRRVLRGGSWNFIPRLLRAASRLRIDTGDRGNYFGFRLARTLAP